MVGCDGTISRISLDVALPLTWTEDEAVGAPANLIFTPEDDRGAIAETEMRLAVTEGRGEDDRWHLKKDGSRFWATV